MYLPNAGKETCEAFYYLSLVEAFIAVFLLLRYVVVECHSEILPSSVEHGVATQYPLLFRYVVVTQLTGMLEDIAEEVSVNGDVSSGVKGKGTLAKYLCDVGCHLISLLRIFIAGKMYRFDLIVFPHDLLRLNDGYSPSMFRRAVCRK